MAKIILGAAKDKGHISVRDDRVTITDCDIATIFIRIFGCASVEGSSYGSDYDSALNTVNKAIQDCLSLPEWIEIKGGKEKIIYALFTIRKIIIKGNNDFQRKKTTYDHFGIEILDDIGLPPTSPTDGLEIPDDILANIHTGIESSI